MTASEMTTKYDINVLQDNELEKEYEVLINTQSIITAVDAEIEERAKTFKLAGFREGKVPLSIVRSQIGGSILSQRIDEQVSTIAQNIINERRLFITNKPHIEIREFNHGGSLKFLLKINVLPTIPDVDYSSKEFDSLEVLELQVSEQDIQQAHNNILEVTRDFKTAPTEDYKAHEKDAVIVDYIGKIDDKEFEGNSAQNLRIVIGNGQFLEDMEKQLIGLKKGDDVSIHVTFPVDYEIESIAGKIAIFQVKVHEVLISEKAAQIDDQFAKEKLGVENVEELNKFLKQKMQEDFSHITRVQLKQKLFEILGKLCDFETPESAIKSDFEMLMEEYKRNPNNTQNRTEEELHNELMKIAKNRVKMGFILVDLVRKSQIQVTDEDIQARKQADIRRNPGDAQQVSAFYEKAENLDRIKTAIMEDKVVDFIIHQKLHLKGVPISTAEFNKKLEAEQQNKKHQSQE